MPTSFWCCLDRKGPSAASDAQNLLSVSLLIAIGTCVSTLIGVTPTQQIQDKFELALTYISVSAMHWLYRHALSQMSSKLLYLSCADIASSALFCK